MIEQEKDIAKEKSLSVKQMIIILAVLALLATLVWGYNLYRLKHVTFDGLTRYTEEEFKQKLEQNFLTSLTPFFCLTDTFMQKEIPFVEKYEIDYVDRQTARILVHEKRVTGCVIIMGRYMFFDKDGIIVETSMERVEGIPVITGLEFDEILLYQKLQVQKQSLFDTILQLTRLVEKNKISVQEIAFDANYEVTLYAGDNIVLLGKKKSYDEALNALAGIIASLQGKTGTLDMRNYSRENGDVILKQP